MYIVWAGARGGRGGASGNYAGPTRESKAELRRQREAVVADPRTRMLAEAVVAVIDQLETQALSNVAW
jgi:hypothetical protein